VGLAGTLAVLFLRLGLGVDEATGDSVAEGDAAPSTGGVASALFGVGCFSGEGGSGGVPVSICD
jgi:hypothetical protein